MLSALIFKQSKQYSCEIIYTPVYHTLHVTLRQTRHLENKWLIYHFAHPFLYVLRWSNINVVRWWDGTIGMLATNFSLSVSMDRPTVLITWRTTTTNERTRTFPQHTHDDAIRLVPPDHGHAMNEQILTLRVFLRSNSIYKRRRLIVLTINIMECTFRLTLTHFVLLWKEFLYIWRAYEPSYTGTTIRITRKLNIPTTNNEKYNIEQKVCFMRERQSLPWIIIP